MNNNNNSTMVILPSSQQNALSSANRGKGWSLNKNRKNLINVNNGISGVSYCTDISRDKEGNEVTPTHEVANKTSLPMIITRDEEGNDQNMRIAFHEAQNSGYGEMNPESPIKENLSVNRNMSFTSGTKENSPVLMERGESFVSPSLKSETSHLPSTVNSSRWWDVEASSNATRCLTKEIPVIHKSKPAQPFEDVSSTDRIKQRSAEISQLRSVVEEKVIAHQYRTYYMNNRKSWGALPQVPDIPVTISRPKSACGFLQADSVHRSENQPLSFLDYRNNNKDTAETNKLQSLEGQPLSSPDEDHNRVDLYLCHRCSSPFRIKPGESYLSSPVSRDIKDASSRYSTPPGSPTTKAPYHRNEDKHQKHKTANATTHTETEAEQSADGRVNYYPNCDATIWIRSCTQEVIEPITGIQIGEVPRWLRGALIRNGPGRIQIGDQQYNHVFDGSALLHRFRFKDGLVTYQNRFLQSRSYLKDTQAQRIVVNYFGTRAHPDPCKTILQNIASKFSLEEHFTDNAQISLYPYGDSLYALTETPFMFRVDPDTLATQEKVNLTRHIAIFTHTAHPHVDRDGTVYNLGQGAGPLGPRYHICKFPKTKTSSNGEVKTPFEQAKVVGTVSARWLLNPCYMHSFAMTDNYWVIIEQPLVVSVAKILKVLVKQDALIDALQWYERETKIHVVRRDTGRVTATQYVTETFFFLHTINAYEDRGHIVLDIAAYKNAEMLHCMFVEALKNAAYDPSYAQMFRGRPKRWVLPLYPEKDADHHTNLVTLPDTSCSGRWLKKGVMYVTPELLADIGCEVPRIYYEEYNGRHYQYFYAICSDVDHPKPGTLVKVDVVNKRHYEWSEDNVYPSEPVFVPAPNAKREDEGVVLSALLRARGLDREVCMLVLDATTFTELARVEFTAPGPVPKCLHGWFVPEGTLTAHHSQETPEEDPDHCPS